MGSHTVEQPVSDMTPIFTRMAANPRLSFDHFESFAFPFVVSHHGKFCKSKEEEESLIHFFPNSHQESKCVMNSNLHDL